MNLNYTKKSMILIFPLILTGCFATSSYQKERDEANKELVVYEKAYKDSQCHNVNYKFTNGLPFNKNDSLSAIKCLDIEKSRNSLRAKAYGSISISELVASRAYEDYRAIFTFYSEGEISLPKARELYAYAKVKNESKANEEMDYSNRLLAQGRANQRRDMEQINRNRAANLDSLTQSMRQRPMTTTRCTLDPIVKTVNCITQ